MDSVCEAGVLCLKDVLKLHGAFDYAAAASAMAGKCKVHMLAGSHEISVVCQLFQVSFAQIAYVLRGVFDLVFACVKNAGVAAD